MALIRTGAGSAPGPTVRPSALRGVILEATDLDPARPGVQLTRLSANPDALTETLALRAGLAHRSGPLSLPQISYQRVPQTGKPLDIDCRFAA